VIQPLRTLHPVGGADALDDSSVIASVLDGDSEAYAFIVRRYQEPLFRFALGMVHDPDTASDLVQEAFVKAYTTLDRCRDPSHFGAWIHRILRNRCLDYLKRHRRQKPLDSAILELADSAEGVSGLERRDLRAVLSTALGCLPEAQREAFLMKHLEERPYEEMAQLLGTSISALKMRVKRARETMQQALAEILSV